MPTTGVINSKLLKTWIGSTPVAVTCLSDTSLEITNGTRETTCKDSGQYEESLYAQTSWSISGSALYSYDGANNGDEIATLILAQTVSPVVFGTGVTGDTKFSGSALWTKFSISSPGTNQSCTISFEAKGTGALTQALYA